MMMVDPTNDSDADDISKAIKELFHWQYGDSRATNFSSLLFHLFQKADKDNLAKLFRGFPHEAVAWKLWRDSSSDIEFFRSFGHERTYD